MCRTLFVMTAGFDGRGDRIALVVWDGLPAIIYLKHLLLNKKLGTLPTFDDR